jgi:polysaccharide deacetylase family protein (PEP-CTERM system associated)
MSSVSHALTIDVEDWAALMCMYLGRTVPVSRQFGSSVRHVLDLLDEYQVKGTFYVIASHATQEPEVAREIVARGHEIGSHGWTHMMTHTFTPESFREDIRRSVETLEELSGKKVYGHRCPFFSLLPGQTWALETMAEVGLEYDSSMTSMVWARAGEPIPEQPFVCRLPGGGSIVEFPAQARKIGPLTARYLGGRGLRNMPRSFCVNHLRKLEQAGLPGILYLHTYEVMPDTLMQYVPSDFGFKGRMKLAVAAKSFEIGMGHMQRTIRHLLSNYSWAPARGVIDGLSETGSMPTCDVAAEPDA